MRDPSSSRPRRALGSLVAVTLVPALAASAAAAAGDPTMFPAPLFPTGNGPHATACADFDGDGAIDVAVSNEDDDTISLLFGLGDGTLSAPVNLAAGDRPMGLVAADFDADGAIDLAVADRDSDDVRVLLGQGDGEFAAPIVLSVGDGPTPLTAADVDADGVLDLVVGNGIGSSTTILLGVGDGSFEPASTIVTGREPSDIAIGDLDADGRVDIVTANSQDSNISVLMGQGGGAFSAPVKYAELSHPSAVAIANLDADLVPDVAVAISDVGNHGLFVRSGLGNGGLGPALDVGGKLANDLLATDLDGDADTDLLLASPAFVRVFRNDQREAVQPAAVIPAGESARGLSLGDLDGDGRLDLVAAVEWGDVVVLRGQDGGTFDQAEEVLCGGSHSFDLRLADVDRDGRVDAITVGPAPDAIRVLRGVAGGGFAPPVITPIATAGRGLAMGDVDGDALHDVAVAAAANDSVQIHHGAGDGSFVAGQNLLVPDPDACVLLDLDGDGDLDLAATSRTTDTVRLFANSGAGSFTLLSTKAVGDQPSGLDAGDLNGDGLPDLVVANVGGGTVSLLLALSPRVFAAATTLPSTGFDQVHVVDIDGDGRLDLARNAAGLPVHTGHGDGTFSAPVNTSADLDSVSDNPVLADLDGDGRNDLAIVTDKLLTVLPGLGAGSFGLAQRFTVASSGGRLATADLDADGAIDLLTTGVLVFDAVVTVAINRASLPWLDLGNALAGGAGLPHLKGTGSLAPATPMSLALTGAAPTSPSALVAGLTAIHAPFKGGVMVPAVNLLFAIPTGPAGGYSFSATWPATVPPGFELYLQSWISDPAGPAGFAASNALRATTP